MHENPVNTICVCDSILCLRSTVHITFINDIIQKGKSKTLWNKKNGKKSRFHYTVKTAKSLIFFRSLDLVSFLCHLNAVAESLGGVDLGLSVCLLWV